MYVLFCNIKSQKTYDKYERGPISQMPVAYLQITKEKMNSLSFFNR